MNEDKKAVTYNGRLAKHIILDMIIKDIELYDVAELPFDTETHIRTYIITKKEIDYETFE
jgi:hypothetical protein